MADFRLIWDLHLQMAWTPRPPDVGRFGPDELEDVLHRFRRLLSRFGVTPNPTSWIAREFSELEAFVQESGLERSEPWTPMSVEHWLGRLRRAADLLVAHREFERAAVTLDQESVGEILRLLGRGSHPTGAPAERSQARDRVFEIVVAGAIGRFATDVALEEPDVICQFEGLRWGVACKVAYSDMRRVFRSVKRGADQLQRSEADTGIVAVRVTDIFPHERLVPRASGMPPTVRAFRRPQDANDAVEAIAKEMAASLGSEMDPHGMPGLIARFPKLKAVILLGHTVPRVPGADGPVPAFTPVVQCLLPGAPPPSFTQRLCEAYSTF